MNSEQRKLLKEIREWRQHVISVCSDPMNGCPEDFAHDFARTTQKLYNRAFQLGIPDSLISRAEQKGTDDANLEFNRFFEGKYRGVFGLLHWKIDLHRGKMQYIREYREWRRNERKRHNLS